MTPFAAAIQSAFGAVQQSAGVSIVYTRGSTPLDAPILAVPGQTLFQFNDQDGGVIEYQSRDYIVSVSDLRMSGNLILPQRGDYIAETQGNTTFTYEVSRPEGIDTPWRYCDVARTRVRIHTKLKSQVST